MNTFIVVDHPGDWPLDVAGTQVVAARAYLTDPAYGEIRSAKVFNLCRAYRYQSLGYYVSLLAEARGHKPLPRAGTIEDLQSLQLVRALTAGLDEDLQRALLPLKADRFELSVYFGRNLAARYDALAKQIFELLRAPLLRADFERHDGHWRIRRMRPIAAGDIPPPHRDFVLQAATDYLQRRSRPRHRRSARYDLAILHDPNNTEPPSNPAAMQKFARAAEALGLQPELITPGDIGRLPEFDALFIRDTTFVNHYTYRFARRAAAEGLVVIDDPDSILRCNNKVYLAELAARHGLPAPRTLMVHRDNVDRVTAELALPCVLKQPDSSFSIGVEKVETPDELQARVAALLEKSDLIVAQEWLPTEFDWRVGVLGRRVLFVCRYYMAPGHWQIVKHEGSGRWCEGRTVAYAVAEAPEDVVRVALKAANLIGDGFYGVDVKQVDGRCYLMEINDNPNVDAGNEDGVLKDALYREVMGLFLQRIEERKRGATR